MAIYNEVSIRGKLQNLVKSNKTQEKILKLSNEIFKEKKVELLEDFDDHIVTEELKEGEINR